MSPPGAVPLCPSAPAGTPDAVVIGIVGGTVEAPRVRPLERAVPLTDELLALTEPARPAEVLRVAAPCACSGCRHYENRRCSLAEKVARVLPTVTDALPECPIRGTCRWFAQEGGAACRRCPQVVTETWNPSVTMLAVAHPDVSPNDAAALGAQATEPAASGAVQ